MRLMPTMSWALVVSPVPMAHEQPAVRGAARALVRELGWTLDDRWVGQAR
jgi:hypothetical protein